jgi:hypothetical protein
LFLVLLIGSLAAGPLKPVAQIGDSYSLFSGMPGNFQTTDGEENHHQNSLTDQFTLAQTIQKSQQKSNKSTGVIETVNFIEQTVSVSKIRMYVMDCLSVRSAYYAFLNLFYLF